MDKKLQKKLICDIEDLWSECPDDDPAQFIKLIMTTMNDLFYDSGWYFYNTYQKGRKGWHEKESR